MSTESAPEPSIAAAAAPQPAPTMGHSGGGVALYALAILTIAALVSSVLLWQRVTNM